MTSEQNRKRGQGPSRSAQSGGGGRRSRSPGAKERGDTARAKRTSQEPTEDERRSEPLPSPRLLVRFRSEISPELIKEFGYASPMQAPRLSKIILNIGIGAEASQNARAIESATRDLTLISGQRPVTTRARKSVAGFKVREGMPVGITVTLRGRRMYEFFDKLVSSVLPRIRDFRGIPRESFDGRGNYALGIREQVIFPEVDYNSIDRLRGLQVIIVTTAPTDREGLRLLELLGAPFARSEVGYSAA